MSDDKLREALEILGRIPSWEWGEDAQDLVLQGLRGADAEQRAVAIELASDAMNEEVARELLCILSCDPDAHLCGRAATALGPSLEECSEVMWENPMEALDESPYSAKCYQEVEERLRDVCLDHSVDKEPRRRALESAVRSPQPWQEEVIRTAYRSGDKEWRITALFCMGHWPGFEDEILDSLDCGDREIELEAVRSAGSVQVELAGPHLLALAAAAKGDREIRLAAMEALAYTRPEGAHDLLESLVDDADEEVSEVAEAALEEYMLWGGMDGDVFGSEMPDGDGEEVF